MNSFLNIQVRIIAQQAMAQIRQLQGAMSNLGSGDFGSGRLDRLGSQMQWLGRQIEYNFTVPLVLAGSAAMKMALDNETAFVRITKVYGDATHGAQFYHAELDSLKKAFVALSDEFGIAQSDALNIAADWAAAGASGLALAKSVELTMKTMVLGELDAATATQSLIAIQAQYGLSISQLGDTIDVLNMVENQTGISMAGLIAGFTRVAGVARSSGVGVRELAADLAALTPATGSAANAGNALKTIFSRLLSPTKQTAEVLGLMGINTHDLAWESANAQDKLLLMAHRFEGLSTAQQGFVSSIIASRYQVNRFEVLMQELTSSTGYYQRALQSTADMNAVYKQSVSELNAVLTSNPQRLKIIWTMLQNALANVIQPLIPALLWLATGIENVVSGFADLNPSMQKFVLFGLAALAVIGPLVRYLGAIQVLVFELSKIFALLLVPLSGVVTLFRFLIIMPVSLFFNALAIAMRGMFVVASVVGSALPYVFTGMMAASRVAISVGAVVISELWALWLAGLGSITGFFTIVIPGLWRVMWFLIEEGTLGAWGLLTRLYVIGLSGLETIMLSFAAFSGRVWRLITVAPIALFSALFQGLASLFTGFLPFLRLVGIAIFDALTGPIGIAVTVAVVLILTFWKQIQQAWNNVINWFRGNANGIGDAFSPLGRAAIAVKDLVLRAFNALPTGIQNAMIAVVDTVASAAKAVYHWFSYLNPWAKHSPSLVDNVKSGTKAVQGHYDATQSSAMGAKDTAATVTASHAAATGSHADAVGDAVDKIRKQYAELTAAGSAFAKGSSDLDAFTAATARVQQAVDAMQFAKMRKDLAAIASDALPAFDRLVADLGPMNADLARTNKALESQSAIVVTWKSNLDDANATLKLQQGVLDGMKSSVDGFTSQVNAINGDLEVLNGTREALRSAGAGSDILKGYDDQIAALKGQKKGINDQLSAAQSAYKQQKQLVDDLTASRDKLQASYDAENQKLQLIQDAYDKIKTKINDMKQALNDFSAAADALKPPKQDATTKDFNAGAGANTPDVGGSGGLGREGGIADQASAIDAFTQSIKDKTKNLFGLFNFMDPLKKAWNAAWTWLGTTFGPIGKTIGDFFSHIFDGVSNPLAGLDFSGYVDAIKSMLGGISGFFTSIWSLIGPPLQQIGHVLMDVFGSAVKEIGPELGKFKDLVKPIGDLFKELAPVLKVIGAIIGGVIMLAINILVSVLANTLGPILHWIIDIVKSVIQIFRGLIEFIVGVFTGNWSLAWKGIKDFFGGIWDAIWSTIKNAGLLIWGIVKGIVEGIWNFFKWVYNELIGHSIIPDIVNGIIHFFNMMKDFVLSIWNALVAGLKWVWDNILKPVFDLIMAVFKGVWDVFSWVVDRIIEGWDRFKQGIINAWNNVKQYVGWIKDKWNDIYNGIRDVINSVRQKIDDFIGMAMSIPGRMANIFGGMWDGIKHAFQDVINWVIDKWNALHFDFGPIHVSLPHLSHVQFAAGGIVDQPTMAVVGEGRKGYPEYVIPTDPMYRTRAVDLFVQLGMGLGMKNVLGVMGMLRHMNEDTGGGIAGTNLQFYAAGGILGRGSVRSSVRSGSMVVISAPQTSAEYHFHGDLSFPNIRSGKDAEEFVKNLQALVG